MIKQLSVFMLAKIEQPYYSIFQKLFHSSPVYVAERFILPIYLLHVIAIYLIMVLLLQKKSGLQVM